jgi:phage terminase large subunit-like protein
MSVSESGMPEFPGPMVSTWTRPDLKFGANWVASADAASQDRILNSLTEGELLALPFLFEFWALPHQLPPEGDWRSWVILGGRGAGKTRAGAEWVRSMVEGSRPLQHGKARRVALVGETIDQAREVMVFGESGILACTPPDRQPRWEATRKRLVWDNGAEARLFSAHDPEALRGPQFDAAWCDELAKWRNGRETWDMLQFGLRLGDDPRAVVTTTPRDVGVLRDLLDSESSVLTQAATEANRANLAASFLDEVRARYAGTRLGRQELDGVLLGGDEDAYWSYAMLDTCRVDDPGPIDRIVVAVDPPVSSGKTADECGIVVVGVRQLGSPQHWTAVVLEDASVQGAKPLAWARAAVEARDRWQAERLVAEVNQGGEMVESVVRQVDPMVPFRAVHATRGKHARAEPVSALYEQGKVSHLGTFEALEDQMCRMGRRGYLGRGSPDRLDALVWAMHDAMLEPGQAWKNPRIRALF